MPTSTLSPNKRRIRILGFAGLVTMGCFVFYKMAGYDMLKRYYDNVSMIWQGTTKQVLINTTIYIYILDLYSMYS